MASKMPRYCLDTSGISNPLVLMPEDIHPTLWARVRDLVADDVFCCNAEIYGELGHIEGQTGAEIMGQKSTLVYEIGQGDWDWQTYLGHVTRMRAQYQQYISEYNGNRSNTVGLNDVSIVALAKTVNLPLLNMEGADGGQISAKKMRIPRLCGEEGVKSLTFNEVLRKEGICA